MRRFFGRYLRQRAGVILAFVLFCAVFGLTFALYGLPLEAVAYPALLCFVLWLCFALRDLVRVRKKHRELERISRLSAALLEEMLPEPKTQDDADYQQIIRLLLEQHRALREDTARRYEDMVEYYTLWAHQIKTPIAAMRLTLQNEDTPLSHRLKSELFRVEQYVEMVLVFLRLDAAAVDYVIRRADLDGIVRGAVRKFSSEFIERRLRLDYEPLNASVLTDEKWLSFVIEQLLSNALKYTPTGSIRLYLEPEKTLCIEDTGIGVAPEDLPRVFEKGFTGYNGRGDKSASGIGLYLCRRICKRLGHTLSITSEPGKGTCVRLDLAERDLRPE